MEGALMGELNILSLELIFEKYKFSLCSPSFDYHLDYMVKSIYFLPPGDNPQL